MSASRPPQPLDQLRRAIDDLGRQGLAAQRTNARPEASLEEWAYAPDTPGDAPAECAALDRDWGLPPVAVLGWRAGRGLGGGRVGQDGRTVVWVMGSAGAGRSDGRAYWPTWLRQGHIGADWLWLSDLSLRDRLWAAEKATRCGSAGGITAVVCDGRGFSLTQTRRLQLAAEASPRSADGPGCRVLLWRDAAEMRQPSAARVRGLVRPQRSAETANGAPSRVTTSGAKAGARDAQRWTVELLRRKGLRPADDLAQGQRAVVEIRRAAIVVERVPAAVGGGPLPASVVA